MLPDQYYCVGEHRAVAAYSCAACYCAECARGDVSTGKKHSTSPFRTSDGCPGLGEPMVPDRAELSDRGYIGERSLPCECGPAPALSSVIEGSGTPIQGDFRSVLKLGDSSGVSERVLISGSILWGFGFSTASLWSLCLAIGSCVVVSCFCHSSTAVFIR
ncbi:hypothetical protein BJX70DRAFT_332490 [Aspergillus crustosus]